MKIAVLGAGMVGRAIALDLVNEYSVTSFDVNEENLQQLKERSASVSTVKADLRNYGHYAAWLTSYDLVITAVPGFMGFDCLKAVIK